MTALERQLLTVQKLRGSMTGVTRMYFHINEILNIKSHTYVRNTKNTDGRGPEERFAENRKEVN